MRGVLLLIGVLPLAATSAQSTRRLGLTGVVRAAEVPKLPIADAEVIRATLSQAAGIDSAGRFKPGGDEVVVSDSGLAARTDSTGRFTLTGFERGVTYRLTFRRLGFREEEVLVEFTRDDTVTILVELHRAAQQVAGVDVTTDRIDPRLSDYEASRRSGRGRFITREQIEEEGKGLRLLDILSQRAGNVRFVRQGPTSAFLTSRRGALASSQKGSLSASGTVAPPCKLKVFIDGVDQRETNLVPFDVPAELVEAIEIFTGADLPMRYSTIGTACGAVNIWRRVLR